MIANTIGTDIEEEDQDKCIERDLEVKIEVNYSIMIHFDNQICVGKY